MGYANHLIEIIPKPTLHCSKGGANRPAIAMQGALFCPFLLCESTIPWD